MSLSVGDLHYRCLRCLEEKLLVLTAGAGNILRIAPALTVTEEDVDEALERLARALEAASRPQNGCVEVFAAI